MMGRLAQPVLAVDVGNTSCHFGLVEGSEVVATGDCRTSELLKQPNEPWVNPFATFMAGHGGGRRLRSAYCSVVPRVNAAVEAALVELTGESFHLTAEQCPGLKISYPKRQEIGEDRLANALAAEALYGAPVVVIDMGTAVTFDVVTKTGGYEGGIIAPGLAIMTRYLHEQTALLPELTEDELIGIEGGIGRSTVDAMRLGCSVGFSGMLAALLDRVEAELEKRGEGMPVVLGTGGSVRNLSRAWTGRLRPVPHLTLRGLAIAVDRFFAVEYAN